MALSGFLDAEKSAFREVVRLARVVLTGPDLRGFKLNGGATS
jgi:hypothetical protein